MRADAEGKFEFTQLPAGALTIFADKPGYLVSNAGAGCAGACLGKNRTGHPSRQ